MMLAESSRAYEGSHLSLLGAGWVVAKPDPEIESPYALGIIVSVPRDEVGTSHEVRVELLDFTTEEPVVLEPPYGDGPLVVSTSFVAKGRPDQDLLIPVNTPVAINLYPFPLQPSHAYKWRLFIDGETRDHWVLPFRTTPS